MIFRQFGKQSTVSGHACVSRCLRLGIAESRDLNSYLHLDIFLQNLCSVICAMSATTVFSEAYGRQEKLSDYFEEHG